MSQPFRITTADGIAELILDNPPVNAFDSAGWFAIADALDELGRDDGVRVIVIVAAEGKGFCAGVDIKELAEHPERIVDVNRGNYETYRAIHLNPKPVILALHGFVLGGGIGMSGAADILVASDCAVLACPRLTAVRWGEAHTCSGCSRFRRSDTCTSPASLSTPRKRIAWVR